TQATSQLQQTLSSLNAGYNDPEYDAYRMAGIKAAEEKFHKRLLAIQFPASVKQDVDALIAADNRVLLDIDTAPRTGIPAGSALGVDWSRALADAQSAEEILTRDLRS